MFECTKCGKGAGDGTFTYRNGPIGEATEWRCQEHLDPEYVNEAVMRMAAAIERVGQAGH